MPPRPPSVSRFSAVAMSSDTSGVAFSMQRHRAGLDAEPSRGIRPASPGRARGPHILGRAHQRLEIHMGGHVHLSGSSSAGRRSCAGRWPERCRRRRCAHGRSSMISAAPSVLAHAGCDRHDLGIGRHSNIAPIGAARPPAAAPALSKRGSARRGAEHELDRCRRSRPRARASRSSRFTIWWIGSTSKVFVGGIDARPLRHLVDGRRARRCCGTPDSVARCFSLSTGLISTGGC